MKIHNVDQKSEEWFSLRAGIPTASEAGKLLTGTGKESAQIVDYAYQLAAEKYAGRPLDRWEGNSYTERGTELEDTARLEYELMRCTLVEQVGFCTTDNGDYGCSPDGLVDDEGIVEIKCLAAKNHVKAMVYFNKHKKAMPDYMPQVQMQMLVCERAWCDLVFYHPDLPLLVIREVANKEFHKALIEQLKKCVELRDKAFEIIGG